MEKDIDLKEIERKAYLSYHQDGVVDIMIGFFILALGLEMLANSTYVALLGWMPVLLYWPFKRLITYPRMGYVNFSPERKAREKKKRGILLVAFSLIVILGLLVFLVVSGKTGLSQESVNRVREYTILIFGTVLASLISLGAIMSGVRHLYAYTALALVAFFGGYLLGVPRHLYFISVGAVIMLSGVVVLIRFLNKYRRPAKEEYNGEVR